MKSVSILSIFIMSFFMNGCGKSSSGAGIKRENYPLEPEGIFSATLYSVNKNILKNIKGAATVTKYGDYFDVRVKLKDGPHVRHTQGLYAGITCPNEDTNQDGYIDLNEATKDIGHMVIPFDGDLSGQVAGNDYYPNNSYNYERTTSYALMLSDLPKKDRNLQLEGKGIVIHGAAETNLVSDPSSIPIACGILKYELYEPEPEPETSPIRIRPKPEPDYPEVEIPGPEVERPRGFWRRFGNRLERWWDRLGGWRRRGNSGKP